MIVLVLIASWILVISLVVGVCASARGGDAQLLRAGAVRQPAAASPWAEAEVPDPVRIVVRANARVASTQDDEASFVGSDSVAA
jgi:hypothetical protein